MKFKTFLFTILFTLITLTTYGIDLQWDANPPEDNVTAYTVYWQETSGGEIYNQTTTETTLTINNNLFKPNVDYTFWVTAHNEFGESNQSNLVNGIVRTGHEPPEDNLPDEIIVVLPSNTTITIVTGE